MNERNRKNIIAAVLAILVVGLVVIAVSYFVRIQNETKEKNLKITPSFTGRPDTTTQ